MDETGANKSRPSKLGLSIFVGAVVAAASALYILNQEPELVPRGFAATRSVLNDEENRAFMSISDEGTVYVVVAVAVPSSALVVSKNEYSYEQKQFKTYAKDLAQQTRQESVDCPPRHQFEKWEPADFRLVLPGGSTYEGQAVSNWRTEAMGGSVRRFGERGSTINLGDPLSKRLKFLFAKRLLPSRDLAVAFVVPADAVLEPMSIGFVGRDAVEIPSIPLDNVFAIEHWLATEEKSKLWDVERQLKLEAAKWQQLTYVLARGAEFPLSFGPFLSLDAAEAVAERSRALGCPVTVETRPPDGLPAGTLDFLLRIEKNPLSHPFEGTNPDAIPAHLQSADASPS